ncbi:MAG: GNAT family N-acetyltransferase [Porticoccaceae bacterium]|jgi:predicted GNAT family N-acyltransferase|nr:GNAT family N-acetyltransferase [Porticoccaceae bacterium]
MTETIDFFPITIEQTSWQSSREILEAIRREVFIDEQRVPDNEEVDDLDPEAIHWIAWGQQDIAMATARLVNNKIGRMAVLKPFRKKGVGSSLLRAIIRYGIEQKFPRLILDAQVRALHFYKDNGFVVTGQEFKDAGIAHVPMAMDLNKYLHRRFEPKLPDINEELRQHVELSSSEEFARAALTLVDHSDRTIRIFSDHLNPRVYDSEVFCSAIHRLATRHVNARVQLLVRDNSWLGRHHHRLVEAHHRLQSRIELRCLTPEIEVQHQEFMSGDEKSVLYFVNPGHYQGYLCLYSPIEARRLNTEFDSLWSHSEPDPQMRKLYI